MSLPYLLLAVIGVGLICALLAIPSVRTQLVGNSNLRHALIPLVTAVLVWGLTASADMVKNRIEEDTAPDDALYVHVQSVEFGLPRISMEYFEHDYSTEQLNKALAPFKAADANLNLTSEEIDRLNAIADASGMLDPLDRNKIYTTGDVIAFVRQPLAYTFNYLDWAKAAAAWSGVLRGYHGNVDKNLGLQKLIAAVHVQHTSAGLFRATIGMAWRANFRIPDGKGDCLEAPNTIVQSEETDGTTYMVFSQFRTGIGRSGDPEGRKAETKKFIHLFEFSCVDGLENVFEAASSQFVLEADLMKRYVEEWNRILASKQPEMIRIRTSLSNVGRFDSFVRTSAKVSVGPIGTSTPLTFTVRKLDPVSATSSDEEAPPVDGFLQIKSRNNVVVTFQTRLSKDLQSKLYGTYQSELGYLRLGILASAGSSESRVLSQVAPFSSKAKIAFERRIDDMVVPIRQ